jgi:hypothetical protein
LAKKVMPDLRPSDVEIAVNGHQIIVTTGIARLPTDPPIDVTPTPPAISDASGSPSASDSVTTSSKPAAPTAYAEVFNSEATLPPGRPWHASSSPAEAPRPALPSTSDPRHDDNLDRNRASDAKIAALNSRAAKFVA